MSLWAILTASAVLPAPPMPLSAEILFIFSARLFARLSDQGRLEDLLRSLLPSSIAYLSALNTAVSALAGRRSSQEFRGKLRGRSGSNTIFSSNR